MKLCFRCRRTLSLEEFGPNRARSDGRQEYCRPCKREYANALYGRTKAQTLTRYGLTRAEWDAMHADQDGRCAICSSVSDKTMHVDHDHATGAVRGLLCGSCNLGLGKFRDDPQLLRRAVDYLEQL